MAITRCPYCHAIIDEADKYCNNCGTQLLFSEDEEVEEEIPGEKIIDAEVEEKDYTVDEPDEEKKHRPAAAKDLEAEIGEELEDEIPAGTGRSAVEELMAGGDLEDEEGAEEEGREPTEEVVLVDEIEEAAAAAATEDEEEIEEPAGEDQDLEDEIEEEPVKAAEAGEGRGAEEEAREYRKPAAPAPPSSDSQEPEVEYVTEGEPPDEAATAGEASFKPVTFDSQELENLGKTVELGREKIDKFIEVLAAKKVETGPVSIEPQSEAGAEAERQPAPEPEPESATEQKPGTEAVPAPTPERPSTGTLPPWASTMKGAPVFLEDTHLIEGKVRGGSETPDSEEVEIFPRRRDSDSTMGLPEKISQAPLPFTAAAETGPVERAEAGEAGEEAGEEEREEGPGTPDHALEGSVLEAGQVRPLRESVLPPPGAGIGRTDRAEALIEEAEEPAPRPPFSLSVFVRSKLFDLLFVGLFWLVALWLAASSMGETLFDILNSVSGPMLLLYAVFVLLYFFLFKFFLGETLGDRLFRPRERG